VWIGQVERLLEVVVVGVLAFVGAARRALGAR
jgi:hypothetical protein